jgi:hypothetical protein
VIKPFAPDNVKTIKAINMTEEEKYLYGKIHRDNPFRVPDGYFDRLADEVMARLPEEKPAARLVALRPWLYAAACLCIAVIAGVSFYFNRNMQLQPASTDDAIYASTVPSDSYFDDAANHMMVDNQDIYACLTSEY